MAEQSQNVQGLKTMLKGKDQGAGSSVKDQVKAALLKNKPQAQGSTNTAANSMAQQIAQAQAQTNSQSTSGAVNNSNAATGPMLTKIEKTVDSINEVHSTMESLNKNMNMFVDLFNRRGGSLASGGDSGSVLPTGDSTGNSAGTKSNGMGGIASAANAAGMAGGQDAVTTLLLTNLLKKNDNENEEKLSTYEKGSKEYLDLLIKKLDKFQHEYELLQYLFEPKMFGGGMQPTNDDQGNSAWLAGFMSMMMNKKR
ncbi:hypothetical protein NEF87_000835 [Candidatus Lokiarchaeum ossiferum]|uniref:DUF4175 domain-containing protein n=1 Tax=Candidatus Lokiarchaeum ossiferum TaxID=2951803 RepID=A0ABY6HM09_9ARCH|nr:hypothetical protein NEF87_000835 [Candidatus Lokiarchaeum sp. B-35]